MFKQCITNFPKLIFTMMFIIFITTIQQSQAVLRRHDRSDADYRQHEFDNTAIVRWSGCSSTLIAEKWVLTAAHCVLGYDGNGIQTTSYIDINGVQYQLMGSPITHPEYISIRTANYDERHWDIALLKLQISVPNVTPIKLYEADDELNQLIELWGYGGSGDGLIGQTTTGESLLRKGTNRVNRTTNHELFMDFTHPDSNSTTEFESHIGNGDSGGPALLSIDLEKYVAGVGSTAFAGSAQMFKYGSSSVYERVSSNLGWLKLHMGDEYPGEYNGPLYQRGINVPDPTENRRSGGGASILILLIGLLFLRANK